MTILGLDIGKFKSVACWYDPRTRDAAFTTVATDPDAIRTLLSDRRPDLVAFETCTVAGWVADICSELGLAYQVANPMDEAWRWSRVKRKTDRDDALKLARMAALGQLPTVHVPSPEAATARASSRRAGSSRMSMVVIIRQPRPGRHSRQSRAPAA